MKASELIRNAVENHLYHSRAEYGGLRSTSYLCNAVSNAVLYEMERKGLLWSQTCNKWAAEATKLAQDSGSTLPQAEQYNHCAYSMWADSVKEYLDAERRVVLQVEKSLRELDPDKSNNENRTFTSVYANIHKCNMQSMNFDVMQAERIKWALKLADEFEKEGD